MTNTSQQVAITGATGTAGRAAALALRDAGHKVRALGRTPAKIPGIEDRSVDFADPEDLRRALDGYDALVSCIASRSGLPGDAWAVDYTANRALLNASQAAGLGQFVLLSAICVQKPRLAFQQAKLAFEAELVAAPLTHSIVRPTAFFKSLSGQAKRIQEGKPYLMFGDGRLTACTPISDRDLGLFIASCLDTPARQNAILPIGGPGPALTPAEMGEMLFAAFNQPVQFRRVPPGFLKLIAGTLSLARPFSKGLAAKAELARIGHYYATESMLLWDAGTESYSAEATPAFGTDTLADFYADLARGTATVDLGAHAVF